MEEKIYLPKKKDEKKKEIIISILAIVVITIIILVISSIIKNAKYKKTYEYKLKQVGYNQDEINILLEEKNLDIEHILTLEYNDKLTKLIKEKYYINKNLDTYLKYIKENSDKSLTDCVSIVNVKSYNDWYTDAKKTDTSKDILILVNKFYTVDENYEPNDLVTIKNWYAYGENQLMREEAYQAFISMYNAAKEKDLKLIINSAYRPYSEQKEIYDEYLSWYGQEYTDALAAHPGSSEHQTGLAIDVMTPGYNSKTFDTSKEFEWLQDNAYLYGYILRYPKNLEYLTGYDYESWHYRYVGKDVAEFIHNNNITYDEYYAYFIENNEKKEK